MTGFSPVRLLGRISPGTKGILFGPALSPRASPDALPTADHAAIAAQLAPSLTELECDRTAHVDRIDRALKLYVGGAALIGLVLGWLIGGDLVAGLFLMGLAALSTVILIMTQSEQGPRTATRFEILTAVAAHLSDMKVDPSPSIPSEWFARLRLVQPVRKVIVDIRLTGHRAGRKVAVSRVGLMFGSDKNYSEKHDKGLTFVMVEIDLPETAHHSGVTAVMPSDGSWNTRFVPKLSHGLAALATGDADFDKRYSVYGDPAPLTPDLRNAFTVIEHHARCAVHGMAEVAPGAGLRPWVAIIPGQLVVLTPLAKFDGAFEPPPYWQPLDPDTLIPAFASDLAILEGHLSAALSLPLGELS